jgi:hypothetical protein
MTVCYNCGSTAGGGAIVYLPPDLGVGRLLCTSCQTHVRDDRSYTPTKIPEKSETRIPEVDQE